MMKTSTIVALAAALALGFYAWWASKPTKAPAGSP